MTFNSLTNSSALGIIHFINDLNTRFENLLFSDLENYAAKHLKLARLDIKDGIPMANSSDSEYSDGLFDDNYYLVSCFIESGNRKELAGGFEPQLDLLVSVNMNKFSGYNEEGIINAVRDVMLPTSFNIQNVMRDTNALKGIVYDNIIPDSMYPYFIFRIKTKLVSTYKVN